jgi:hypothetical protein
LKEIELTGWKYTWANNLDNPTFEKLDRVLVTMEWEENIRYPWCGLFPGKCPIIHLGTKF